jgi:hypothetical protein
MFDGITPVASGYDPIVAESPYPIGVVVTNAGPAAVRVNAWTLPPTGEVEADVSMELRAGAQRFVVASLVRASLVRASRSGTETPLLNQAGAAAPFAAVGWRVFGPRSVP